MNQQQRHRSADFDAETFARSNGSDMISYVEGRIRLGRLDNEPDIEINCIG